MNKLTGATLAPASFNRKSGIQRSPVTRVHFGAKNNKKTSTSPTVLKRFSQKAAALFKFKNIWRSLFWLGLTLIMLPTGPFALIPLTAGILFQPPQPGGEAGAAASALGSSSSPQLFEKEMRNSRVRIRLGDLRAIKADACVVPAYTTGSCEGGVAGSLKEIGVQKGFRLFERYVKQKGGELPHGEVLLTESGGGNTRGIIHVVSVNASREDEFDVVRSCVYTALKTAETHGLRTLVIPALGTGQLGKLSGDQSAKAILSAIHRFAREGGSLDVTLAMLDNSEGEDTYRAFGQVLAGNEYETARSETGTRPESGWVLVKKPKRG